MSDYNGWKNWETWNVALWLQHDEGLYAIVRETDGTYEDLARILRNDLDVQTTPDNVAWDLPCLDTDALGEMLEEVRA